MKQLIIKHSIFLSLVLFTACTTPQYKSPSQNSALNKISNSTAQTDKGSLQSLLDSFIKDDWLPTFESDKESEVEEEEGFTLQKYVDKSSVYIKAHPSDYETSNVHRMEKMPVIGSKKRR